MVVCFTVIVQFNYFSSLRYKSQIWPYQPSTAHPNAPTLMRLDLPQSVTHSYAFQLCSFSWPIATHYYVSGLVYQERKSNLSWSRLHLLGLRLNFVAIC